MPELVNVDAMQFWFYARQRNGRRIVRYGRMKEYIEVGENIVCVFCKC